MSVITDVLLWVEWPSDELHAFLTAAIPTDPREQALRHIESIETESGGTKVFCPNVYAAAFNHVPTDDVYAHLGLAPWEDSRGIAIVRYEFDEEPVVTLWGNAP